MTASDSITALAFHEEITECHGQVQLAAKCSDQLFAITLHRTDMMPGYTDDIIGGIVSGDGIRIFRVAVGLTGNILQTTYHITMAYLRRQSIIIWIKMLYLVYAVV